VGLGCLTPLRHKLERALASAVSAVASAPTGPPLAVPRRETGPPFGNIHACDGCCLSELSSSPGAPLAPLRPWERHLRVGSNNASPQRRRGQRTRQSSSSPSCRAASSQPRVPLRCRTAAEGVRRPRHPAERAAPAPRAARIRGVLQRFTATSNARPGATRRSSRRPGHRARQHHPNLGWSAPSLRPDSRVIGVLTPHSPSLRRLRRLRRLRLLRLLRLRPHP
jgi:hypothetical protein